MTIDCTSIPMHLQVMRAITGVTETPGSEDNPKIMAMRDWIACSYPEMMSYCELYTGDDVAWCGLTAAFCCTVAAIRPPFGPTDTDKFLWAQSFASDSNFEELDDPVLGAIVVMTRSGGGHVTFFEGWDEEGETFYARGGNQSDAINVQTYPIDDVIGFYWPVGVPRPSRPSGPTLPAGEHNEIAIGASGPDVVECQTILGIVPADGDFGPTTEGGVKGFQRAEGLEADGCVGQQTWEALDALWARKARKTKYRLSPQLVKAIVEVAENSAIAGYNWKDRGEAPRGWTAGLACCFALAVLLLDEDDEAVERMARAEEDDNEDCLHWYLSKYRSFGMDNSEDGVDVLRHLFALILGLGMRESSGRYSEGRDLSASNVESDTAEAGCLQTSWNIRACDDEIEPLLDDFMNNPNGFLEVFQRGVTPDSNDLDNFGNGDAGTMYQFLSKYAPCFHVFVTAIGMRSLGGEEGHWGPLRTQAAELRAEADDMFWQVQELVMGDRRIA